MIRNKNITMFLWFIFLGTVLSKPTDEFREFTKNEIGDLTQTKDKVNIVPGFISSEYKTRYTSASKNEWIELLKLNSNNKHFKNFDGHIEKGSTSKGITFCIYNDNLREAAISLFRIFQTTEGKVFEQVRKWAKNNVNKEMYMYALRLESLYSSKMNDATFIPPFIWNPNFFVNSEVLSKASLISEEIQTNGEIDDQVSESNHYNYVSFSRKEYIVINSNYSGWNLPKTPSKDGLDYFREDISLNSYYYGLHLLHPFWMSNEELEFQNPRFAEHYYNAHQQLAARYNLEKLHLRDEYQSSSDDTFYVPYLTYKNGLPFPTRACFGRGNWDNMDDYVRRIDIAIRECISRGLIIMQNGTTITMTDDSHINILAKLIRANLDGIKFAKILRNIAGYGGYAFPIDEYNPAPSILHQPETSLRDPAYWRLLGYMLDYFTDYKSTMKPFDLSEYETDEFEIVNGEFSKLITSFENYIFSINNALSYNVVDEWDRSSNIAVRQRRLTHEPFSLNFTVESTVQKNTVVRLYLGPECGSDCWNNHDYNKFYELDTFEFTLQVGSNLISWSPESSDRLSFDDEHNSVNPNIRSSKYSIFRFPKSLLLPKGLEEGLNLTLFIMITSTDSDLTPYPPSFYREFSKELDSKPLGFPFHRQAEGFKENANNYKFYNISVYHKTSPVDTNFFSPHLY